MEPIQQFELILMSKMAPPSPSKCSTTEDIIFEDSFANELFLKHEDDDFTGIDFLAELEKDEKMYLDELQQITEKIDLPLYDFVTGNDGYTVMESAPSASKTQELLMEFDSIYDAVELEHLTPPQTPPEQKFLGFAEESQQFSQSIPKFESSQFVFEYPQDQFVYDQGEISVVFENSNQSLVSCANEAIIEPIISSPADLKRELEVVDEIIQAHSRAQSDYDDTSSSWSPRSEYSNSSFDEQVKEPSGVVRGSVVKKRTRAYGRNPDEKKSRKKEQNKNAATRYRQKKKEEVHEILGEERQLMDKNKKLTTAFKDTKREVKYLRSLLRELFQARGLIP